jgi:4-(gamma-glutamylamino)butanal dehydrogenase
MNLALDPGPWKTARATMTFRTQTLVDGKYCPDASGKTYASVNPENRTPLAAIADCGPEDVDVAVQAARRAFQPGVWSKLKPGDRKHAMLSSSSCERNALELAMLDCLDAGKPIRNCDNIDIPDTIHCICWHAGLIGKLYERTVNSLLNL